GDLLVRLVLVDHHHVDVDLVLLAPVLDRLHLQVVGVVGEDQPAPVGHLAGGGDDRRAAAGARAGHGRAGGGRACRGRGGGGRGRRRGPGRGRGGAERVGLAARRGRRGPAGRGRAG